MGCAIIVLLYTYTESVGKNYDEEGKEKSVAQTWPYDSPVSLGCEH